MDHTEKVRARIAEALSKTLDQPSVVSDIAFHMTDWDQEFDDLLRIYLEPEKVSDDEIRKIVISFLVHAPTM